jgi:O-antigen/teichoic acid export membrane protein
MKNTKIKKHSILYLTILMFTSNIILIIIGFGIKKIQTLKLGDINYGEYAFFISLITFVSLFFRFGFFVSLQNLLSQNYNEVREKKFLSIGYIIALINGFALSICVWILSFIVNDIFNTNIGSIIQLFAPLTIIYPFHYLFTSYGTGTNKLKIIALYILLPKVIYITLLLLFLKSLNLNLIILLNLISTFSIIIYFYFKTKPDFSNIKKYWNLLWIKNNKYGFHYYKGAIANQTTYKLDELFISYFLNTKLLGFYSLSLLITSPMILMSQSINQSMFKQYSSLKKIPANVFIYNTLWLLFCVIFLYFFSDIIVNILFGEEFISVGKYAFYISFALLFQGLSAPYSFLAAKSKGKEIRNVAWSEAIINITGNLILIPLFGIIGAILTSILAKIINFILFRFYYKKYLAEISWAIERKY